MASVLTPLNQTSLYQFGEEASGQTLTTTIIDYSRGAKGTEFLTYEQVEDAMADITSRTSPFQSKTVIDRLVRNGFLKIVYNDETRLTTAVPFFRTTINGKVSMIVNITNYSKIKQDGRLQVNPNTLYAFLLSAAYASFMEDTLLSSARDVSTIYARLVSNVISNLGFMDNLKKEKFNFLAINFYYYSIYPKGNLIMNPMYGKFRYNSADIMKALDAKIPMGAYGDSGYRNLQIFIENLKELFPEMKKLNFKNFIDRWATSYGSAALFAPEYIPYFFFMLIATAVMAPVVNINKISLEAGDGLTAIYRSIEHRVTDKYSNYR